MTTPENDIPITGQTHRIASLDGFRGVAVLIIVLFHGQLMRPQPPMNGFLEKLIAPGWSGVTMFFVLSGFLITGILYDTRREDRYFRTFYARRVLRIFPLYYAVIIAWFGARQLLHKQNEMGGTWTYFVYLANLNMARIGGFRFPQIDLSWSLSIEEQFYLIWPLLVFMLSRRAMLWLCAVTIFAVPLLRSLLVWQSFNRTSIYVLTPTHLDALAIGASIALLIRGKGDPRKWIIPARIIVAACAAVLAVELFVGEPMLNTSAFSLTAGLSCFASLFGGLLMLVILAPGAVMARCLRIPALRTIGKYSYAMYLFHVLIGSALLMAGIMPDRLPAFAGLAWPPHMMFDAILLTVTFAAAWLSWHCYEKHFLRLKRFFEYDREPKTAEIVTSSRPLEVADISG